MPRTKVNRNVANNKRVRETSAEIEEILRDFDIECKRLYEVFINKLLQTSTFEIFQTKTRFKCCKRRNKKRYAKSVRCLMN